MNGRFSKSERVISVNSISNAYERQISCLSNEKLTIIKMSESGELKIDFLTFIF